MREQMVDWRTPVVLMLARVVVIASPLPILIGLAVGAQGLQPILPPVLVAMATATWALRSRTLSLAARGWLTMAPLSVAAVVGTYQLGTIPGPILIFAIITVEIGLIQGVRAGVAALLVTAVIFVIAGAAGRETSAPRLAREMALAFTWRLAVSYVIAAGTLLVIVTMAVRSIETALAERMQREQDLQRAYQQLGQLTRHLEAAKEDERRHIARELHDELGQALTLVKLNLKLAGQAPTRDEANRRLDETMALVDRTIQGTRELSRGMRPPLLDELGLAPALQAFVDEQARLSNLRVELRLPAAADGRLSTELETAVFRIVQETVTNVIRHADARTIGISVERAPARLHIAIRDDGRGFEPAVVLGKVGSGAHLGLVGMRERARPRRYLRDQLDARAGHRGAGYLANGGGRMMGVPPLSGSPSTKETGETQEQNEKLHAHARVGAHARRSSRTGHLTAAADRPGCRSLEKRSPAQVPHPAWRHCSMLEIHANQAFRVRSNREHVKPKDEDAPHYRSGACIGTIGHAGGGGCPRPVRDPHQRRG